MPTPDDKQPLPPVDAAQSPDKLADPARPPGTEAQPPGTPQQPDDDARQIPAAGVDEQINHPRFSREWIDAQLPRWRMLKEKLGIPNFKLWYVIGFTVSVISFYATLRGLGYLEPVIPMAGDFRVAVAAFEVVGDEDAQDSGRELAQGVFLRMEDTFAELDSGFTLALRGPDDVSPIRGATREARARAAAKVAERIDADLVVYGLLDTTQPIWMITPEFYISGANLADAEEITGQHEIGRPFEARGQGSVATRISVSTKLTERAQLLSLLTVGLSHYAAHDYAAAQAFFEEVEREYDWSEIGGREVLYLLLGNAAGKSGDIDLAESAYQKALVENPDYSRAYSGLGSVYYIRALQPVGRPENLSAIDVELINRSIGMYERAAVAPVRPAFSDIETKVKFGLGQAYLALHLQDAGRPVAPAVEAFEAVVAAYGDGDNERVRELAAEAHSRLGLIYTLAGDTAAAIEEYEQASELAADVPERREIFERRIEELRGDG